MRVHFERRTDRDESMIDRPVAHGVVRLVSAEERRRPERSDLLAEGFMGEARRVPGGREVLART